LHCIELTEDGANDLVITMRQHGIDYDYHINSDFVASPEYGKIRTLNETINKLMEDGAYIKRGEKTLPVTQFKEALDWLMTEAKRGQYIQRYKGLGEMNPIQLWETTMDPDYRRMLQVTIEDAVSADQLFTCLMGDHVEPRREFIETNALNVENLDV
jgi:DNA gyrase subunit B